MNNVTLDFYQQQAQRGLQSRTGRSRPVSRKSWAPTRKEWEKMNGPCIVTGLPQYSSLRGRLLYLMGSSTWEEFATKCGISRATFYRAMSGKGELRDDTYRKIALACGVEKAWLKGAEKKCIEPAQITSTLQDGTLNKTEERAAPTEMAPGTISPSRRETCQTRRESPISGENQGQCGEDGAQANRTHGYTMQLFGEYPGEEVKRYLAGLLDSGRYRVAMEVCEVQGDG